MITEVAFFYINEGMEARFEKDFAVVVEETIALSKGYIAHTLHKCIETEGKYMVQVEWETLEDHMEGFVGSDLFKEWVKKMDHYFKPNIYMEHFKLIK
ncbi:antibiotic biosynthesis monooxygenase [Sutcliffiella horikoshii]|uniref:antibiotic biosynthesis monooxygenase family protein n=1 Tax=Sutcliffiella horikoshii TaxID=79883 RepID=UPI00384EA7D1